MVGGVQRRYVPSLQGSEDGITQYKRVKGNDSSLPIAAFGEKVLYNLQKKQMAVKDKTAPAWIEGAFFRYTRMSNGYIIGTIGGDKSSFRQEVPRGSTMRNMQGIPWRPVPHRHDSKIPTHIPDDVESEDEVEEPEEFTQVIDEQEDEEKSGTRI